MTCVKPYDETTADDFRRLFLARFPDGDPALLDRFLVNPARRGALPAGVLAYEETGRVKAILGLLPRTVCCGQDELLALNGVALAVRKDADRSFFTDFVRDAVRARGADLYFVNTAIPPSRTRTAQALENLADGPNSCAEIRERAIRRKVAILSRVLRAARARLGLSVEPQALPAADETVRVVGGLTLSRERVIESSAFDLFWSAYRKENVGLVSSRTAEELRWAFDLGLATGDLILMTAREDGFLRGYVFCRRTDATSACWRVVDLIAHGNDARVLELLIVAAADFLRHRTPATCLQVTGFPAWVQPLFARLFPTRVSLGFNKCVWACLSNRAERLCGDWVNAKTGWYGCPYDGDMCLI